MHKNDIKEITTIDAYIESCDATVKILLKNLREIVRQEAPEATEKISYGMPTFYLKENLVHFAAAKHHIGFYPTPSGVDAFKGELTHYAFSKGSIRFPLDKEIPYDLIRRIVRFRVEEVRNK